MVQMRKFIFLLVASIFLMTACTSNETTNPKSSTENPSEKQGGEKVLYVQIGGEVKDFDPHYLAGLPEYASVIPLFNGLVRLPPGTVDVDNIEGDLAEKWESNETATEWTFYLRKGVQWHKGYGELTSEHVKKSFERVIDVNNGISAALNFKHVNSIETPDDYTVKFILNEPDPNFLTRVVNFSGGHIVNMEAVEADEPYIGTGPFMFEEYKTQDQGVLVKNKDYFRGEPKIDKIILKVMADPTATDVALEKGDIHIAFGSGDPLWIESTMKKENLKIDIGDKFAIGAFFFNTKKAPFDDIRVRQAVAHAIDVEAYVKTFTAEGVAAVPKGPVPESVSGAVDVGAYEYNPEKAKQLLKEAGYENGLKLPKQFVSTGAHILRPMTYVQDQLKQVGIDLPLEKVEHTTFHDNNRKAMHSVSYVAFNRPPHISWWMRDVYYGPSSVGTPTGSANYSLYSGSDDKIAKALVETEEEKANALYAEIQQEIKDFYAIVPFIDTATVMVRNKRVKLGYNNDEYDGALGYYYEITENTDLE